MKSTTSSTANRDRLSVVYAGLVPGIAASAARRLPASFDTADLHQVGMVAILDAGPRVEKYLRQRIYGAMINSVRGSPYRESKHSDVDTANLGSMPDPSPSSLSLLIDEQQQADVQRAVRSLHPDQVIAINSQFPDGARKNARPKKAAVVEGKKAVNVLRVLLARAA